MLKLRGEPSQRRETSLARHVDLFPTVMHVAGLDSDYGGLGVSLLAPEPDALSFSEADGRCTLRRAIVTERYKYIYTVSGDEQALLQQDDRFFDGTCAEVCRDVPLEELYDLHKDPYEKQNLLQGRLDAERAQWLERLRMSMATHLNLPTRYTESVVTGPREGLGDEENKELLDSLRTLGYIQ